jgi:Uncharacterized conserved protein
MDVKFLCDEMLKRLARWLRAAGYDTAVARDGVCDRALIEQAIREGRRLITRDQKLMEIRRAQDVALLLQSNLVVDCVQEISLRLGVDWLYRPFTRCLLCNTLLEMAEPALLNRLGWHKHPATRVVYHCPHCAKLYWEGGHVQRMRARLSGWQRALEELP